MIRLTCNLCNTPCGGSQTRRDCPRCGRYAVPHFEHSLIGRVPPDELLVIRGWVCDQNRNGIVPTIDRAALDRLQTSSLPSIPERVNLLVREAFDRQRRVGDEIDFTRPPFLSATYSEDQKEIVSLLDLAKEKQWVRYRSIAGSPPQVLGQLTLAGYVAVEEMLATTASGRQAFVAMWFDESMRAARERGIIPGIMEAGYVPMVIDGKEHIGRIDDEIIAENRRSRFMVADFTHGDDGARGSVYYEAGFAEGLAIPVVATCRQDRIGEVHFDRRQYNHILWRTPDELRQRLSKRISAVIGDGPDKAPP